MFKNIVIVKKSKILQKIFGGKTIWNGNFVSTIYHARSDSFRWKFISRTVKQQIKVLAQSKDIRSLFNWKLHDLPFLIQMAMRVPFVYDGMVIGGGFPKVLQLPVKYLIKKYTVLVTTIKQNERFFICFFSKRRKRET